LGGCQSTAPLHYSFLKNPSVPEFGLVRQDTIAHPNPLILVTGPARSGKSEWAEHLAASLGQQVTYVATAALDPHDQEWQLRIQQHQQRRPAAWQTLEAPVNLADCIHAAGPQDCLLVDSLGTWLAPLLEQSAQDWQACGDQLLACLQQRACSVIFVAEETGWGVVPAYPLGRCFRDRLGSLTRQIGGMANRVYLVTGGYVLNLSALGQPLPIAATKQ
jgi:adenosylcobinamide kinase/adenosylcobinamide-phosphate guanylyltransferase